MVLLVNHVSSFSYDGVGNMTNDGSTAYTYDAEGRPTQYKFVVGSSPQTVEGDLTWNQDGTLKTLAIADPPTPANAQTCNYGYDDLARIGTVNCLHGSSVTFSHNRIPLRSRLRPVH